MSETEPIMSGNSDNIEVMLARMEGKIDRVNDRMERYERDQTGIRARVHDVANEVQILLSLNLPAHIAANNKTEADHDARITALENLEQQRKGAQSTIKVLWAIMGAITAGGAATILRVIQVGGF